MKSIRLDDLDQLVDVLAERFAKLEQSGPFCFGGVDLFGEPSTVNGQFFGQILDVASQPVFGSIGNEHQQRVKQSGHFVTASNGDNMVSNREIALFLYPAVMPVATLRRRKRHLRTSKKMLFVSLVVHQWGKGLHPLCWLTQREVFPLNKEYARGGRIRPQRGGDVPSALPA